MSDATLEATMEPVRGSERPCIYEVTITADPAIADRYERWLRERHVFDMIATGCFIAATLDRGEGGRFRVRYRARTRADVERYLATHAAALRGHAAEAFPEGLSAEREVWTELEAWSPPADG
ncbi:MAG: DUF4286 family protein [Gemmatimonadales bacterium]|nr:DUF4286 family protein [Gemmatimonadales bacterium]